MATAIKPKANRFRIFMTFLTVVIVALSLGLMVYYFVQDRENIRLDSETINVNKDDTFTLKIILTDRNQGTMVRLIADDSILEQVNLSEDGLTYQYKAIAAGSTIIELETSNSNFNNLHCNVRVGDGSVTNPFYIKNGEELSNIGSEKRPLDKNYLQVNNIDLMSYQNWAPIGGETGFSGNYDGAGYTIFGLKIVADTYLENAGLFSKIKAGANVQRIVLANPNISGNIKNAGSIAGTNNGAISRIEVQQGNVESVCSEVKTSVGGVVGTMTRNGINTKLDRLSFVGNVDISSEVIAYAGGLAGSNYGGTIINSYSRGGIKANCSGVSVKTGGIAGLNTYTTETVSENKYNTSLKGNIINCYSTAVIINATVANKGAIVGQNRNPISNNSSYTDEVDSVSNTIQENRYVGVYYLYGGEFNNIAWTYGNADIEEPALIQGASVAELKTQETFQTVSYSVTKKSWDFDRVWDISASVNDGYPTLRMFGAAVSDDIYDPQSEWSDYGIDSMEKLVAISNDLNGTYDIIDSFFITANWTPLGTAENPFNGTLRGNGETITFAPGIGINYFENVGLFGYLGPNANLIDIDIQNINISVGINVGGLAGFNAGVIENCSVAGNITLSGGVNKNVGGLVGYNIGQITGSEAKVNIATTGTGGVWNIGGLVGYNNGNIANSESGSESSITSNNTGGTVNAGGLIGASVGSSTVAGSASYGDVILTTTSGNYAGGLVGYMEGRANISKSRAGGNSVGVRTIKGHFVGGLAGYLNMVDDTDSGDKTVALAQCQAFDNLRIEGENAGGLVGRFYRGKVDNCATYAHLHAKVMAGFSVTVEGSTDGNGNGRYAVIDICFSSVTFDTSIAGSRVYAETQSFIRGANYMFIWTALTDEGANPTRNKVAGYINNSKYNKSNLDATGVAEKDYRSPTSQQGLPFISVVYKDGATSDTGCKDASNFDAGTWRVTVWKIENGHHPQVRLN